MTSPWVLTLPLGDDPAAPAWTCGEGGEDRHVVFRGVLYDRSTLAESLGRPSQGSATDAALIQLAFLRWDFAAVRKLRGAFAVALVDRRGRRAVVARDPLGSHPLFYAQSGRLVAFSDSPEALTRLPGISSDLNRAAIADHLCHRWPRPHETFYQAVRRIPPGCQATVSDGRLGIERYWDPAPADRPIAWTTEDDLARFDTILDRAVDRCIGESEGAIFLSGGLDSISVAAVAADRARRMGRRSPWALSLALPDPECDERSVQSAVAKDLGLRHRLVDFREAAGPDGLLRSALRLNRELASPLLNFWGPAYLSLASQAQQNGVETVLTGSGGDEWLSVSPYVAADMLRTGDVTGFINFLGVMRRSYRHPFPRQLRIGLWTFGLRPLGSQALSRLVPSLWQKQRRVKVTRRDPKWIAPDPALRREQLERAPQSLEDADPAQGFYLREVRSGLDHFLTSWELEEQHEFGRRIGASFRHPYWDADLVDMLYRTPPRLLHRDGRAKGLVRGTLARRFPSLGLGQQRKVSATGFFRSLVAAEGPAAATEVGPLHTLARLGIVSRRAADTRVAEVLMRNGPVHQAWELMNLEMWTRWNAH